MAADAILAKIGQTSQGCPYIAKWFQHYRLASAADIERAISMYAPAALSAKTAAEIIQIVLERIRSGLENQVAAGLDEVDEAKPMELTSKGELVQGLNPPDVAQLGCTSEDPFEKALNDARRDCIATPSPETLRVWRNAKIDYFQKRGATELFNEHTRDMAPFTERFKSGKEKEEGMMNAMVNSSSEMNKYLTRADKSTRDPAQEERYGTFARAIQKAPPVVYRSLTSQAERVPGMTETGEMTVKPGEECEDPIIRFYGDGLVGPGKYLMRVSNLRAYNFTDMHSNRGFDESIPGGGKEDQIVTLAGTRLRFVGIEARAQPVYNYEFVS